MANEKLRLTAAYAAVQFFYWFCYGIALSYASPFLLACGLTNTAIGVISAAACALSVWVQPLLATYADRENSLSIKTLLLIMAAAELVFGVLLIAVPMENPTLNGLLQAGAILIIEIALPFVNALATETMNAGRAMDFSAARGMGSLGYALMSLSIGALIARLGEKTVPWSLAVFAACFLISVLLFPFEKGRKQAGESPAKGDGAVAFARRYPAFAVTLAGCVLIYLSHVLINNFLFQIVVAKGGNSQHMGASMALAGVLEVVTMVLFSRMLKKKDCGFWFRISGIFFALKALGTLLAPSIGALYAVQLLQMPGWGLMTVASVYYVNSIMAERDRIKGQAYMTMSLSVGTILASLCGGWLIDVSGVNGMLTAAVLCGAAGSAIVLAKKKEG